jgi:hypothetical protein
MLSYGKGVYGFLTGCKGQARCGGINRSSIKSHFILNNKLTGYPQIAGRKISAIYATPPFMGFKKNLHTFASFG